MAKRRWARALRRAVARGDAGEVRRLLRFVAKWRDVELQRALTACADAEVVRAFACEAPAFWADGGGARAVVAAAAAGRDAPLRAFLAAGADPQAGRGSFEGETALHAAAEAGHVACVNALLAAGADVHARSSFEWTPLHWAAHGGRHECVRLLLAAGADTGAHDTLDRTPLHWAASCGYADALTALLDGGAGVRGADYIGRTPLHLAATGVWEVDWSSQLPDKSDWDAPTDHLSCLRALVERGAEVDAKDHDGLTALLVAAQNGYTDGAQLLLALGADPLATAADGYTVLHSACRSSVRECVRAFLERGVDVQAQSGEQPLHVAAAHACADECVEELVGAGASVSARDAAGRTPLHYAAERCRVEGVEALLRLGAHVDAPDAQGQTALHVAAPHWPHMVRVLVARGASVDVADVDGSTPLHAAAACAYPTEDCVRALLEAGASRTARDVMERTPADVASNDSIRVLIERWALAG